MLLRLAEDVRYQAALFCYTHIDRLPGVTSFRWTNSNEAKTTDSGILDDPPRRPDISSIS